MHNVMTALRASVLFRAAMMAPIAIMLIFSFFNLSAPLDPQRTAAAFNLGIVNDDTGLAFPPIKVSERVMAGMGDRLPFHVVQIDTLNAARAALEAGDIATILYFPRTFSEQAKGTAPVEISIITAQNLTVAEAQIAAQLPMTVQLAMSAGVASLRSALATGQMPSMDMPVAANVEILHPAPAPAALMAPNVMVFATWLAALIGGLLLVLASSKIAGMGRAAARIIVPVFGMGLASLGLALVLGGTIGMAIFLPVWITVWATALCLHWFMGGVIAVFTPAAIMVLLPLAFYQSVIGGTMMPLAAAPDWLARVGGFAPFDQIGAGFRAIIFGLPANMPWAWLIGAGALGIALHLLAGVLRPVKASQ
ncbi:MAG: hypothetical protein ACRBCL_07630 [Maritimibacter sp.]